MTSDMYIVMVIRPAGRKQAADNGTKHNFLNKWVWTLSSSTLCGDRNN